MRPARLVLCCLLAALARLAVGADAPKGDVLQLQSDVAPPRVDHHQHLLSPAGAQLLNRATV